MIRFPPAKINLGLNVIRKRSDGYHDLRSIMIPIPLHDILEVVVDRSLKSGEMIFHRTGIPVPGDPQTDLCTKAIEAFRRNVDLPGLRVHLHKVIPIGAGLGGGSSDGAHMLKLLNEIVLFKLQDKIFSIAESLGSDCAFFLNAGIQLIEGKGERTCPINDFSLEGKWLVLVDPGIHVSTAEAFRSITPSGKEIDLMDIIQRPIATWQEVLINEMEEPVFQMHPKLAVIKQGLLDQGAIYAAMSGSGSTIYGIFSDPPAHFDLPKYHMQWTFKL